MEDACDVVYRRLGEQRISLRVCFSLRLFSCKRKRLIETAFNLCGF